MAIKERDGKGGKGQDRGRKGKRRGREDKEGEGPHALLFRHLGMCAVTLPVRC